MRLVALNIAALGLCLATGLAQAGSDGWIGLGLDVDTQGTFWSPVVQSAKVSFVAPDSPAARQNIVIGDSLIEVAGSAVDGGNGKVLLAKMHTTAGTAVHLKLRRADGTIYERDVVAVPPPQ